MRTVEQGHSIQPQLQPRQWEGMGQLVQEWFWLVGQPLQWHPKGTGSAMATAWELLWNSTVSSAVTAVGHLGSSLPWPVTPHTGHKESDKLAWVKLQNTSQTLWELSAEFSMTSGKDWSESPRCEMHKPGVPADGCHHESRPAKLVPRVHICAFFQQPGEGRDMVRKQIWREHPEHPRAKEGKQNVLLCRHLLQHSPEDATGSWHTVLKDDQN